MFYSSEENRNNVAYVRTRVVMEHTFGVMKSWFCYLDCTGEALYSPEKVAQTVVVFCMSQNIMGSSSHGWSMMQWKWRRKMTTGSLRGLRKKRVCLILHLPCSAIGSKVSHTLIKGISSPL